MTLGILIGISHFIYLGLLILTQICLELFKFFDDSEEILANPLFPGLEYESSYWETSTRKAGFWGRLENMLRVCLLISMFGTMSLGFLGMFLHAAPVLVGLILLGVANLALVLLGIRELFRLAKRRSKL